MEMDSLINENLIVLDMKWENRDSVIKALSELINYNGNLNSIDKYIQTVFEREDKSSTGVGNGIAIPHGKSIGVDKPAIAFARLKEGVEWKSFDDKAVELVFLLAVPDKNDSKEHLKILSTLSRNLLNEEFKDSLMSAQNKEEINQILTKMFQ